MMAVPIREENIELAEALVTEAKIEEEHPGRDDVRDEEYWRNLVNNEFIITEESYAAREDNRDAWLREREERIARAKAKDISIKAQGILCTKSDIVIE